MQRPETRPSQVLASVLACLCFAWQLGAGAQEDKTAAPRLDKWYRTEVLIFLRQDAESLAAEQWEAEPVLRYPDAYRFLLNPRLADERQEESAAYESRLDALGQQSLLVPAVTQELLDHTRPDAITQPPDIPIDAQAAMGADGEAGELARDMPDDTELGAAVPPLTDDPRNFEEQPPPVDTMPNGDAPAPPLNAPDEKLAAVDDPALDDSEEELEAALREVLPFIPYRLRPDAELEFTDQARSLRRRGHTIAFHGSWWAPIDDRPETLPLVLDRGADMDQEGWPALQGSLLVYRSRYLHINLDLWLNTDGQYLPHPWRIETPPLPRISLFAETLRGERVDPWAPPAPIVDLFEEDNGTTDEASSTLDGTDGTDGVDASTEGAVAETTYPWRHAIVHRQNRRMRSGEIHYLDHPVIGVIVKVTASDDELPPYFEDVSEEERLFRERHQLPLEFLALPPEDEPGRQP